MRHTTIAALAAAALTLTACSSAEPPAQAVPVESPSPSPSPSPTPPPATQKVGLAQTSSHDGIAMEVTVLRLRYPFTPRVSGWQERKGYIYAAVEAKVCTTRNDGRPPVAVSWWPWSLSWESGIVAKAASSYSGEWWEEPLYPQDHIVLQGRCARGWIPFEARASDGRPALVAYTPAEGTALEWKVKQG